MDETLKKEHDELLASKPDGVAHDAANCPICTPGEPVVHTEIDPNGGDMSKTYTEDELKAAIEAATAPLAAELTAIKEGESAAQIAAQIAEAVAAVEAEKAELQAALDAALVSATTAEAAHAELVTYLEAETVAAEEAAAFEAIKAERLTQVSEVASFSDEHKAANADRWAKMSEEDFTAQISDWKEIASAATKPAVPEDKKLPAATAMVASRSTEGSDKFAGARQVMRLTVAGNDPRTL